MLNSTVVKIQNEVAKKIKFRKEKIKNCSDLHLCMHEEILERLEEFELLLQVQDRDVDNVVLHWLGNKAHFNAGKETSSARALEIIGGMVSTAISNEYATNGFHM